MVKRKLVAGTALVLAVLVTAFWSQIATQWRFARFMSARSSSCGSLPEAASPALQTLPTRYVADRWFATPVTQQGDTLVLFLDSGGGGVFAIKPVLERLGLNPKFVAIEEGDSIFTGGTFPTFRADASIPAPLCAANLEGFGTPATTKELEGAVGFLGHPWFAGRVWVLDYPGHTMSTYVATPPARELGAHTIPMTLRDRQKKNFPRIRVVVAGDTISMLLDTGATSDLSADAVRVMGAGPPVRASAFVATRLWNRWRSAHPAWRTIPNGEASMKADLIEVPTVTIAGYDVGPIWFAKRRDAVYDNMMSPQMDQPVDASIGGAAFRTFRMTMDYPHQRVTFER